MPATRPCPPLRKTLSHAAVQRTTEAPLIRKITDGKFISSLSWHACDAHDSVWVVETTRRLAQNGHLKETQKRKHTRPKTQQHHYRPYRNQTGKPSMFLQPTHAVFSHLTSRLCSTIRRCKDGYFFFALFFFVRVFFFQLSRSCCVTDLSIPLLMQLSLNTQ